MSGVFSNRDSRRRLKVCGTAGSKACVTPKRKGCVTPNRDLCAVLAVTLLFCVPVRAQQTPAAVSASDVKPSQAAPAALTPPAPPSPVDQFRRLLVMPPADQRDFLAKRSPGAQKLILAKIHEYQQLNPELRELRLRVTE